MLSVLFPWLPADQAEVLTLAEYDELKQGLADAVQDRADAIAAGEGEKRRNSVGRYLLRKVAKKRKKKKRSRVCREREVSVVRSVQKVAKKKKKIAICPLCAFFFLNISAKKRRRKRFAYQNWALLRRRKLYNRS